MSDEQLKQFLTELQSLLEKYDVSIDSRGYCPDDHGLEYWFAIVHKRKDVAEFREIQQGYLDRKNERRY